MAEKKVAKVAKKEIKAEKKEVKKEAKKEIIEEEGSFVYVGKKGAMAYVLAVVTQFGSGSKNVTIKARGKSISRAVDVAEIVRNKSEDVKLNSIDISTEEVQTDDGRPLKVSTIAIQLKK